MAKPASAKPKAFRRARLGVASFIALALGSMAASFVGYADIGQSLELAVSDKLRSACPLPDDPQIAPVTTVEIDDASIAHPQGGRWPWPRPRQAELIDALASLGPRLIVLDIEYPEAEEACVAYRPAADGTRETYLVEKSDARLRESLLDAGNVILPFSLYIAGRPGSKELSEAAARQVAIPSWLARHTVEVPPDVAGRLRAAEALNPMIADLGDAALGSGYTSLLKDPDNAVRRVPLLVRAGDVVFPQLGLEMAGLWRFGPDYGVRLEGDRLTISSPDESASVSVPVDRQAQLSLRWPRSLAVMDRLSAAPLLDLALARRDLANHRLRWPLVMAELDALFPDEKWAAARQALDHATSRAADEPANAALRDQVRTCREALDRVEERLAMGLAEYSEDQAPPSPDERGTLLATAAAKYWPFVRTFFEAEKVLGERVEAAAQRVRPRLEGHLCIVGLNATAVTDQHKTPISQMQPGVTVYPSVLRTILSGIAFRRIDRRLEWVLAALVAWLVGILAARLPTGWAIAASIWVAAGVLVLGRAAAGQAALLTPVAGPILASVVAFAGVSAYRQLTEASSRRWITQVFQQYTSAAHVEEILRDPEALRLGGARRDITVLFTDIAGFTPLSERMDPEKLVALLNHYLSAMTGMLLAEEATLDKYEGDGILAFIGAPVQVFDHALRAVRAALAMQDSLPQINDDLAQMGLLPEGTRLKMRVGCSSGPANVGNFGSEQRFDYTAMGDTVNLGGRLEEANRWLHTRILVPEATRQACGDAVLFRRLGPAQIRGKAQPLPLYEPLAMEPAPAHLKAVAEAFGRAVDALEAGNVDAAEQALADLLAVDPQDGPAQTLRARLEAVRAGQARPQDPWNLARPKEDAAAPRQP